MRAVLRRGGEKKKTIKGESRGLQELPRGIRGGIAR